MDAKVIEVPIDEVSQKFQKHLTLDGNTRIVLSGRYGIGKSYFIRRFFELREAAYNTVFISPANYVVSNNEDIFELIKVDIIIQLFTNNYLIPKKNENEFKKIAIESFIANHPSHIVKFLSQILAKIDLPDPLTNGAKNIAAETIKGLCEIQKRYEEYIKTVENELKLKEEHLSGFVSGFVEGAGNIFEENFITLTIRQVLSELKAIGEINRENILIIDDLDRIDPDHIFRILNILSAHHNYWGAENKFGFDRIIIVCDIENIRKIYEHRYGEGVDFNGYMDKFYTSDYFRFNNNDAIKTFLSTKQDILPIKEEFDFLSMFLTFCLDKELLTLRQIVKLTNPIAIDEFVLEEMDFARKPPFITRQCSFIRSDKIFFHSTTFPFLRTLRLLIAIFGDINVFRKVIQSLSKKGENVIEVSQYEPVCIQIMVLPYLLATEGRYLRCFSPSEGSSNPNRRNIETEDGLIDVESSPIVELCGIKYSIRLHWISSNPYIGQHCYYEKAFLFPSNANNPSLTISNISDAILKILDYFEIRGALAKMGVGATR